MRARFVGYSQRVLETDPIAYWPLGEKAGSVAYDLVSSRVAGALNGAHTAVSLVADGPGDGLSAITYDGSTSYTNIYTAGLNTAFDGQEGSAVAWVQVSGAGVWTDSTERRVLTLFVDGANFLQLRRTTVNSQFQWRYMAGGTQDLVNKGSLSTVDWVCIGLSWSLSADALIAYWDGAQEGSTQTGLGTWAGNLSSTITNIGANATTPSNVWSGQLARVALWDRPLSAAEMADLAVLE